MSGTIWTPPAGLALPITGTRDELAQQLITVSGQLQQAYTFLAALVLSPGALEHTGDRNGIATAEIPATALNSVPAGTNIKVEPALDQSRMHLIVTQPSTGLQSGQMGIVGSDMRMVHKKKDGSIEVH